MLAAHRLGFYTNLLLDLPLSDSDIYFNFMRVDNPMFQAARGMVVVRCGVFAGDCSGWLETEASVVAQRVYMEVAGVTDKCRYRTAAVCDCR